jgi:hypothetical protein
VGRWGLVTGVGDAAAVEAGSRIVNHPVGADEGLFPGLGGDETGVEEEGDRLRNEMVEILNSDLRESVFIHCESERITVLRVAPQGRQPVAKAALGGEGAILEAKKACIVGVAWMVEVIQQLSSTPAVDDAPADQEEDGNGIEGDVSFGRGPAEALSQYIAQRAEVDQAEQEIKVGEMLPVGRVFEILPTPIDVM